MTMKIRIALLLLLGSIHFLSAQTNGFEVVYEEKIPVSEETIKEIPEYIRGQVISLLEEKNTSSKTLLLSNEASYYQSIKKLDAENSSIQLMVINTNSGDGDSESYKHLTDKVFIEQVELGDQKFIVNRDLQNYDWVLGEEESEIIGHSVKSATLKDGDEYIKAWYTTDIEISNGPSKYWGLPGLILSLELPDGTVITAKKIEQVNNIKIAPPKKGKKVSQEELDGLYEQYIEQIKSMYGAKDGVTIKTPK